MFMSSQITGIIRYFLSRNLAIARQRAWDQVVASRGKTVDFWGPYAEGAFSLLHITKLNKAMTSSTVFVNGTCGMTEQQNGQSHRPSHLEGINGRSGSVVGSGAWLSEMVRLLLCGNHASTDRTVPHLNLLYGCSRHHASQHFSTLCRTPYQRRHQVRFDVEDAARPGKLPPDLKAAPDVKSNVPASLVLYRQEDDTA